MEQFVLRKSRQEDTPSLKYPKVIFTNEIMLSIYINYIKLYII
jgi:hypothetical protein